ncbi:hypothetical protein ACFV0C_07910 [Streptomyces sp. NPDC059568]|uniref:hypothetical protein n=1 Tax=Streptomyces sp. NPDC059568 TaxID=3346868 RepID=UPI00367648FA
MSPTKKRHALILVSALIVAIALALTIWQDWLTAGRAAVVAAFLSIVAAVAAWEAAARASDTAEAVQRTAGTVARIESA